VEGPATHLELRLGDVTIALSSRDVVESNGLPAPTDGHPILVEPQSGHVSGHRRAYVADPDGNWIALVSRHNV
jgi:hypothetical protein